MQGIIPYTSSMERIYPSFSDMEYPPISTPMIFHPGQARGVYITIHPDAVDETAAMFERWFADRPEITIVDTGTSDKAGLGFILIEWIECEVDQLFPAILKDMEVVADFTLYGRTLEG